MEARDRIDVETERAAHAFLREISGRYRVREALLFGSRARGGYRRDSDADIAVVLDGPQGDRAAAAIDMAAVAFHVMMETGVMVEAMPLWSDEFEKPETFSNRRLIENIRREGVRL